MRKGELHLTNFLNAIRANDEKAGSWDVVGHDSIFQAPETRQNKKHTFAAEVFSLGMIFFYLLVGERIYDQHVFPEFETFVLENSIYFIEIRHLVD